MSARILITYASTHGQTAKIADRLAAALRDEHDHVTVRSVDKVGKHTPSEFDAVIVGASVHAGHHQKEILHWITSHREALEDRPTAFFSVSLTAADDTAEARATTSELVEGTLEAVGWTPTRTATFAGALLFRKYSVPTRVLMRLIARQHDASIDVHEDVEYTDWDAVERFARDFHSLVAARPAAVT